MARRHAGVHLCMREPRSPSTSSVGDFLDEGGWCLRSAIPTALEGRSRVDGIDFIWVLDGFLMLDLNLVQFYISLCFYMCRRLLPLKVYQWSFRRA